MEQFCICGSRLVNDIIMRVMSAKMDNRMRSVTANGKNLSDLERLARQEKKYCTYQLKNCPATTRSTNQTTNTTHADGSKSDRPKL